jgi:carbamoylphosphate synthase small subunit
MNLRNAGESAKWTDWNASCFNRKTYQARDPIGDQIAVLDYGVKSIVQCMVERGAFVQVFPAKTDLKT